MTDHQAEMIAAAIMRLVHGPVEGSCAAPGGIEALTMAIGGSGGTPGHDSIASGLHDVASAIRDLAESVVTNRRS
jgi:hypothetical protein